MSRITDELIEDVQKYARAISNSGELYMDYAQDALTKIADKEGEYDPSEAASFHTWATRIAIHEIIDKIRSFTASERRGRDWTLQHYPIGDRLERWMGVQRAERDSSNSGIVKLRAFDADSSLPATTERKAS